MVAHESSAGTALKLYEKLDLPEGTPKPAAMEIIAPFMSPYEFFEGMGIRTWPNGHGHTGVHHSIHSDYTAIPGYFEALAAQTAMYKAPTSIVGHDDLEMYERAQEGLHVDEMEWVNIQRLLEEGEDFTQEAVHLARSSVRCATSSTLGQNS